MNMKYAASGTQECGESFYILSLLWRLRARQLTRVVSADAGFLCDIAVVFGKTISGTHSILNSSCNVIVCAVIWRLSKVNILF
jgi:hypothetical protein